MSVHLEEGVLQDVGRFGIAGEPGRKAKHAFLIPLHNRFEGRVVPGRGACDQRLVVRLDGGDDHGHGVRF
jgi:hypothetical protein